MYTHVTNARRLNLNCQKVSFLTKPSPIDCSSIRLCDRMSDFDGRCVNWIGRKSFESKDDFFSIYLVLDCFDLWVWVDKSIQIDLCVRSIRNCGIPGELCDCLNFVITSHWDICFVDSKAVASWCSCDVWNEAWTHSVKHDSHRAHTTNGSGTCCSILLISCIVESWNKAGLKCLSFVLLNELMNRCNSLRNEFSGCARIEKGYNGLRIFIQLWIKVSSLPHVDFLRT